MGITVEQVLDIKPMCDARLLAGESGISREIKYVNIMEVPGVVKWLRGGELLLTAGYVFKDNPALKKCIVYDLAQKGVSALCIKPGQFLEQVPENLITDANNVGLPLLEIPSNMPYSDIMLTVFDMIINQQYAKLKKAQAVHEKLFGLLLRGGSFNDVASLLAKIIGNSVFIIDRSGNIRGRGSSSDKGTDDISKVVLPSSLHNVFDSMQASSTVQSAKRVHFQMEHRVLQGLLFSLEGNTSHSGYILVLEENRSLNEQDIMAIHQGATITALEFIKEIAIFEAEKRLGSELLEDLIFGHYNDSENILRRASNLDFILEQDKVIIIIQLEEVYEADKYYLENLKTQLFRYTKDCFGDYPGGVLLLDRSDRLIVLVGIQDKQQLLLRVKKLQKTILKFVGKKIDFCIGIGNAFSSIEATKEAYREAMLAIRLRKNTNSKLLQYEQIGSLKLFFELKSTPALKNFYVNSLAPILTYDAKNNSELLKTLETYFNNDCNIRKTANELFIHKNTVMYRIQRVEELTGCNLKDVGHKLNLQIAIKAKMVYDFNT